MQRVVVIILGLLLARPGQAQEYYPRDTETYLINYLAFSKSAPTAYLLSAAPGFGLGHFYANHNTRGVIFAVGEVLGLALVIVSPRVDGVASDILLYSGLTVFGGFKVADMLLAPDSVEIHNRKVAKRLKIKALAVRQEIRGGREALAYGLEIQSPW